MVNAPMFFIGKGKRVNYWWSKKKQRSGKRDQITGLFRKKCQQPYKSPVIRSTLNLKPSVRPYIQPNKL